MSSDERRERAEHLWDLWFSAKMNKTGPQLLYEALERESSLARREAARAVCVRCQSEDPQKYGDHFMHYSMVGWIPCLAAAIWSLENE